MFSVICVLIVIGTIQAKPDKFVCNDPRFDLGFKVMKIDIQPSRSVDFTLSAGKYTAGSPVKISFSNLEGDYDSDDGIYVGIRALPQLGYLGQYGNFSSLSHHMKLQDDTCPNTAYSSDSVTSGSLVWTPTSDTYGPVDFTLIWGEKHELYSSVITIEGPPMPSIPPTPPTRPAPTPPSSSSLLPAEGRPLPPVSTLSQQCVASGTYNLPHAPVFIQKLRRKSITFPTGQCIPCRDDFGEECQSAVVECPAEPGKPAIQQLFMTHNCTGKSRLAEVPADFVHCPGPEHYSPDYLDLSRFVKKLQRDYPKYFQDDAVAQAAISEYRRMLHVIQKFPDAPAVPSKLVDLVWHEHILDTRAYKHDSQRLFGKYVHHAPTFGDEEDETVKTEKLEMVKQQQEMLTRYQQLFGEPPSVSIWPKLRSSPQMGAGRLPDCCKAECVKTNCVTCVGCNAIYCGMFTGQTESPNPNNVYHVLPEDFAGFVPYLGKPPTSVYQEGNTSYLCYNTPMDGLTLFWTISGEHIYMKQTLKGETWHSVGFTPITHDMGLADYIVAMFGDNNYTGVRDLYKYDKGNHYPCWDVLTQCSLDGKAGTLDLMDTTVSRANGESTATWTRLLKTPDYKDVEITDDYLRTMFATGIEGDDQFIYHGHKNYEKIKLNFFTGEED